MATQKPPSNSTPSAGGSGPRRLGNQAPPARTRPAAKQPAKPQGRAPSKAQGRPQSASAARRYARSHRTNTSARFGWLAVGVVVVAVAVILIVKLSGGSTPSKSAGNSPGTGRNPVLASASLVSTVSNVPASIFDSIGTGANPAPFVVTKGQTPLTSNGKPRFVYYGAEYCPWCAVTRYSMIAALGRFGSFSGLKITNSGSSDGNIPTFSFYGATYTSKYVVFTPYETQDRNGNPLDSPPANVNALYAKYDGSTSGTPAKTFNPASSAGIPFLDIANKYVSAGAPISFTNTESALAGGSNPGRVPIANTLQNPTSAVGKAINASAFIAEANYLTAAICSVDGAQPSTVCSSSGVRQAAATLRAVKPVG